jgi:hypothetical protein
MHKDPLFHNNITSTADAYDVLAKGYYESRKYKQGMDLLDFPSTLKLLGNVSGKKFLMWGAVQVYMPLY